MQHLSIVGFSITQFTILRASPPTHHHLQGFHHHTFLGIRRRHLSILVTLEVMTQGFHSNIDSYLVFCQNYSKTGLDQAFVEELIVMSESSWYKILYCVIIWLECTNIHRVCTPHHSTVWKQQTAGWTTALHTPSAYWKPSVVTPRMTLCTLRDLSGEEYHQISQGWPELLSYVRQPNIT